MVWLIGLTSAILFVLIIINGRLFQIREALLNLLNKKS